MQWVSDHPNVVGSLVGLSIVSFIGTILLLPVLVAHMPEDYFLNGTPEDWTHRRPVARVVLLVLKNLLGGVLLLAGLAMLLLPGQGVLTILVGVGLLNFPGKRRLELWLAQRASVRRAIGWLRRKAHKPPLRLPGDPVTVVESG